MARQEAEPTDGPGLEGSESTRRKGGGPADDPRHPHRTIPLLPSGPGGVFNLASRGADGATIGLMRVAPHHETGGERGIRTPEARFRRLHTFQACSFNRSDTSPGPVGGAKPLSGPRILAGTGIYCESHLPGNLPGNGIPPAIHHPGPSRRAGKFFPWTDPPGAAQWPFR